MIALALAACIASAIAGAALVYAVRGLEQAERRSFDERLRWENERKALTAAALVSHRPEVASSIVARPERADEPPKKPRPNPIGL